MGLNELHPFIAAEVDKLPQGAGVYVLFRVQIPVHVAGADNLKKDLHSAKARFPGVTHFAAEVLSRDAIEPRVAELRKQLSRVRTAGFTGQQP